MRRFISFKNKIINASDATLSAISSAALYGKGIFTTIAVRDKQPFLWEKHWKRLRENAERINLDISAFAEREIKNSLLQLIEKNQITDARARLTFFDESAGRIWRFETENKTAFLITAADFRAAAENFRLTISPFPVNSASPLAGVKSCSYLENVLALEEAKQRGFDEAIRLNEREEIVSAAAANIFWIKNKKIYTPALETGCLAGTTREFLSENFTVREVKTYLKKIIEADEIFLTSAGIGICPADFGNVKKRGISMISKLKQFLDLQSVKS